MVSIEEAEAMLNEIAEGLPKDFYKQLNGGILLMPEAKTHTESADNDLFILGQYCVNRDLGRYIVIFYGSFEIVYRYLSAEELKEKLREVLVHEFTHHLESLAGERDLEIEDAVFMQRYRQSKEDK